MCLGRNTHTCTSGLSLLGTGGEMLESASPGACFIRSQQSAGVLSATVYQARSFCVLLFYVCVGGGGNLGHIQWCLGATLTVCAPITRVVPVFGTCKTKHLSPMLSLWPTLSKFLKAEPILSNTAKQLAGNELKSG